MSVYVEVSGPDADKLIGKSLSFYKSALGRTSLSCSGIAWECVKGRLQILTVAAALQPFLEADYGRLLGDVRILVRVRGIQFPASLEGIAEVEGLAAQSQVLLCTRTAGANDCKFGWSLAPRCHSSLEISRVAILTCDAQAVSHLMHNSHSSSLAYKLPIQPACTAKRGDRILAIGSPFGVSAPDFFSDMVVSGIVARAEMPALLGGKSDKESSLLLADLAALPGMEGSPVLSAGGLVGMLTLPLSVAGHDVPVIIPAASLSGAVASWSACALGNERLASSRSLCAADAPQDVRSICASSVSAQQLHEHANDWLQKPQQKLQHAIFQQALRGVVGVALPHGHWASGVLISKGGVFATNAHLFDHLSPAEAARVRIRVVHHSGDLPRWHDVRVLHIMTGALDLAILQMLQAPDSLQPLQLSTISPQPGEPCHVAGHALFDPGSGDAPMLTTGNLSKVLSIPDTSGRPRAAMLLSAAAVHVGASGGAILSDTGKLLGIVTSNTKHASGTTICKLNYSIAAEWLTSLWCHIRQCEPEMLQLHLYDDSGVQLLKLWTLQPFLEDNQPLSKL